MDDSAVSTLSLSVMLQPDSIATPPRVRPRNRNERRERSSICGARILRASVRIEPSSSPAT
ncbi:hypothetical protein D3C84_1168690 [compost metagenome]